MEEAPLRRDLRVSGAGPVALDTQRPSPAHVATAVREEAPNLLVGVCETGTGAPSLYVISLKPCDCPGTARIRCRSSPQSRFPTSAGGLAHPAVRKQRPTDADTTYLGRGFGPVSAACFRRLLELRLRSTPKHRG